MALPAVEGVAGAPWERELRGKLDRLVVESELLAGNPLGFTGQLDMWFNRPMLEHRYPGAIRELLRALA